MAERGMSGGWFARRHQAYVDRAAQRVHDRLLADPASFRTAPSTLGALLLSVLVIAVAFLSRGRPRDASYCPWVRSPQTIVPTPPIRPTACGSRC